MNRILQTLCLCLAFIAITNSSAFAQTSVFINEIHYDNTGTDEGEAIEIAGPSATDLTGWSIVLYNGSNGTVYNTTDLTDIIPDLGGGFGTVEIQISGIQNGGPDGIVLFDGTDVVQFLSYEGSFDGVGGVADGLTSTDIGVSESSSTLVGESLQLGGTGDAYEDFAWEVAAANTFGDFNTNQTFDGDGGGTPPVDVVINELDADQDGTDSAEFVELYDGGDGNTDLSGSVLVFFNGSNDTSYEVFDLDGFSTNAEGYFVICGDAANVANCDLDVDPATNLIQNGEDAVALYQADGADFPDGTPVTTENIIDAIVYDTDDADDAELLVLINAGEPQVNEDANDNKDFESNQRIPNGDGGKLNTSSYAQLPPTPGAANTAPAPDVNIVINEVDADQTSTDAAEFVELFDGGDGNTDLSGLVMVFFNGSDDASYEAYDLDGQTTNAEGYFVLCGDATIVANCDLDVSPNENLIQNGADAVALYVGDAGDFPEDTPVSLIDLVDAFVYDTNDSDDAGLLVLLNTDEPQVNEDANDDKDNHSNQRIPNGDGGQRNTSSYDQRTPTPGTENGVSVMGGIAEIFEIQGDGLTSPFADAIVTSENNVVTALSPTGFFIQTPADRADGNIATSDGIFVFTDAAPTVSVGDLVTVTGTVVEFFEFTEFTDVTEVTVVGTGTVPAAIEFDALLPSPVQPQSETEYEQYEGMLITIAEGYVTGPSQSFNSDPEAEAYIVASGMQTFREPGIEFPGIAGLPIWDGNPEVFELDPDKLGLTNELLPLGSTFSATGVLGFEFGGYELWASELNATIATLPGAVRPAESEEGTVASLNLFRLFDDVADGNETVVDLEEYETRLTKFSLYIRNVLQAPDILAVQEAEKLGVLEDLAAQIQNDDASIVYDAYLVEGNDVGGIDVGFLVRSSAVQVNAVTQFAADELLTFDGSLLHDRPPLLLEADFLLNGVPAFPIEVLAVHNRSLSGIDDDGSGERVRVKRLEQAQSIAQIIQDRQDANADLRLTVVGDFNAYEFSDGYVDAVGQIRGVFNPDDNLLSGDDLVNPDLTNQVLNIPAEERYSFIFRGTSQVLDHALTTVALDEYVTEFAFGRGNAGAPLVLLDDDTTELRASDHDGLVLYVQIQPEFSGAAVLAAANSMFIGTGSNVTSGDVLVQGDAADALIPGYELVIGKKALIAAGYEVKADGLLVLPQAIVDGNVTYNMLENFGTINGSETSPLDLPAFEFPAFNSGTPGEALVIVPKNQHVTLAAGAYGHILVRQGGTLELTEGLYDVASLTIYRNADVRFSSAGEMRVAGKIDVGRSAVVGPADGSGLDAADFVLYASGINGSEGGLDEKPAAVNVGNFAELQVNIFAANGSIAMWDNATAEGAFLAQDIWLDRNVMVSLNSFWTSTTSQSTVAAANAAKDVLNVQADVEELPEDYALSQNYPNPFNPTTAIPFSLPETGHVKLAVYDLLGRLVETVVDREMNAGYHQVNFNAFDYPSGAYIYRLEVNNFVEVKKMMLVK